MYEDGIPDPRRVRNLFGRDRRCEHSASRCASSGSTQPTFRSRFTAPLPRPWAVRELALSLPRLLAKGSPAVPPRRPQSRAIRASSPRTRPRRRPPRHVGFGPGGTPVSRGFPQRLEGPPRRYPRFLPLAPIEPYLRAIESPRHDALTGLAEISPLTRVFACGAHIGVVAFLRGLSGAVPIRRACEGGGNDRRQDGMHGRLAWASRRASLAGVGRAAFPHASSLRSKPLTRRPEKTIEIGCRATAVRRRPRRAIRSRSCRPADRWRDERRHRRNRRQPAPPLPVVPLTPTGELPPPEISPLQQPVAIKWRLQNPFRFFTDPADTEIHRATYLALKPDQRQDADPVGRARAEPPPRRGLGGDHVSQDVLERRQEPLHVCPDRADYINPESHEVRGDARGSNRFERRLRMADDAAWRQGSAR